MHRQDRYLACLIIIAQIQITEGTYFMLFPAYLFIVKFKMSRYSFNSFGYYVKLFFNHFLLKVTLFDLWLVLTLSYSTITLCLPVNVCLCVCLSVLYLYVCSCIKCISLFLVCNFMKCVAYNFLLKSTVDEQAKLLVSCNTGQNFRCIISTLNILSCDYQFK